MIGGMIGIERGIGIGDIAVGVREGMRGIETGEAVEIREVVEEAETRGMMREVDGGVRIEVAVQDGIENENEMVYERGRGVGVRDARETEDGMVCARGRGVGARDANESLRS